MQKGFASYLLIFIVVVVAAVGALIWKNNSVVPIPGGQKACTLEAKICPDGTGVGRTGPNCEFAACPNAIASSSADLTNWKSYTGVGFSFKYPPNASEDKEESFSFLGGKNETAIKISAEDDSYELFVYVDDNPQGKNERMILDDYFKLLKKDNNNPNDPTTDLVIDKITKSLKPYNNGQVRGLTAKFGFDYDFKLVWFVKNNKLYTFDMSGEQGYVNDKGENVLDQILSNFKF